jgi:hypothetical protein
MRVIDSLRLAQERAAHRSEARKWLAAIDGAATELRGVAPSATAHTGASQKDFSNPAIINQVVTDANEAAKNLTAWQQNIAKLEQELQAARQAALVRRVLLIGGGVALLVGWLYFR